jgi:hypothetical protein
MEPVRSSQTAMNFYQTTRHHMPQVIMFLLYYLSDVLSIFCSPALGVDLQVCSTHIDTGLGDRAISVAPGTHRCSVPDPVRAFQRALAPNAGARTILNEALLTRTGSNHEGPKIIVQPGLGCDKKHERRVSRPVHIRCTRPITCRCCCLGPLWAVSKPGRVHLLYEEGYVTVHAANLTEGKVLC